MLIFWLALVAAVLALLYLTPNMTTSPETLTIQDILERAEAHNVKAANPTPVIRPDPSGGRDQVIITGESRKDEAGAYKAFRATGRDTDATHDRLAKTKLFSEQPSQ